MSNRGQTIIKDVPPKGKRLPPGRKHKEHESMNADAQSGKLQARVKTNLDEYKLKLDKAVELIDEVEKAIEEINAFEVTVEFVGIEGKSE